MPANYITGILNSIQIYEGGIPAKSTIDSNFPTKFATLRSTYINYWDLTAVPVEKTYRLGNTSEFFILIMLDSGRTLYANKDTP
jgi:hypothetical protein